VEVSAGRTPVIINISNPGTDHAVELARHVEKIGADSVMSIALYYWKRPAEILYEHFSEIMLATNLPFIGYNSPLTMDGVRIFPEILIRLINCLSHFIGIKDASHNWEVFLELGRVAHTLKPDFGLFVGTE
jgi:4-hydroxy-tetrahydrodipicolinate synthase